MPYLRQLRRVCVYCGSSPGRDAHFLAMARITGELLAERGIGLVYGGGNVGLMGAVADAVITAGGEAIGVIPDFLAKRELAHEGLTELVTVTSMHERKQRMADLADAFISLPGGMGTLEEWAEAFTWVQLGLIDKPVGLLNVSGFYDHLVAQVRVMVEKGFVPIEHFSQLFVSDNPEDLIEQMASSPRVGPNTYLDAKIRSATGSLI